MSQIAKAASVLLARGSGPAELFVVRRSANLRFLGGFLAFPGGKVSAGDREVPVDAPAERPNPLDVDSERYAAAARELFEETGALIARRADGSFPPSGSLLDYLRRKLMVEEMTFPDVLSHLSVRLNAADFIPLGSVTTPSFVPTRFNTVFFLARVPDNQKAEVWPGELETGEWAAPHAVLEPWTRGESFVSPPTVLILQTIDGLTIEQIPARLSELIRTQTDETIHSIYFTPGVRMIPLRTLALPPSTHTNAYLIGRNPSYLLDPGPGDAKEQEHLFALLDRHHAEGNRLTAVVLTHHHPDHIGAATASAKRYGVPIYAHPITAQRLKGKVAVDREIEAGERLDLGTAPDGRGPWHLEGVFTPGHAPGHLAFYEPYYRLIFAGDMISTLSSVVIAPPDGDLKVYLHSLERLRALDCRMLLPAHGSPTTRPTQTIEDCIKHRNMREEQLLAALASSAQSVPDLARQLYKGLSPKLVRFAELQVLAGLYKLREEGRVHSISADQTEMWSLADAA
ncbi:MAG TPA: MBL fold metallo-hydrolase [Gemmataceae bacterium]|nr:MBL fold metallo-hydrolase [Gemmataceae bacterium]